MILLILGQHGVSSLNFKLRMEYVELESKIQLLFYDIIVIHFSISKPSTIYCVLDVLCCGPVLFGTGPVTANTNPVTVYTCPVPTNIVEHRIVYYRY